MTVKSRRAPSVYAVSCTLSAKHDHGFAEMEKGRSRPNTTGEHAKTTWRLLPREQTQGQSCLSPACSQAALVCAAV